MNYLYPAIAVGLSYVAAIYFMVPSSVNCLERNHPVVIRHRLNRVSSLCVGLLVAIPLLTVVRFRDLGIVPGMASMSQGLGSDLYNIYVAVKLMFTIYLCKIVQYVYNYKLGAILDDLYISFLTLTGFRDHIFAPITEEFIYRAIVVNLLLLEPYSVRFIVLVAPLLFGFAHLHHGYRMFRHNSMPFIVILVQIVFMTVYTSLFGMLETYLYLKFNHNLLAVIVVHVICNLFSFPDFQIEGSTGYKAVYYGSMVGGILGFLYQLQ